MKNFYSLLLQNPDSITAKAYDELNIGKVLHLKESSGSFVKFTEDSHQLKAKMLIKPLAKQSIRLLVKNQCTLRQLLTHIGLFVKLIDISKESFVVDLPAKALHRIKEIN